MPRLKGAIITATLAVAGCTPTVSSGFRTDMREDFALPIASSTTAPTASPSASVAVSTPIPRTFPPPLVMPPLVEARTGSIRCGEQYCRVGEHVCCTAGGSERAQLRGDEPYAYCANSSCWAEAPADLPSRDDVSFFEWGCDDSSDCAAGQLCCVTPRGAQCRSSCFDDVVCQLGSCGANARCVNQAHCLHRRHPFCHSAGICRGSRAQVQCGDHTCSGDFPICCESVDTTVMNRPAPASTARCAGGLQCPRDMVHGAWECDDNADCAGGVCCVALVVRGSSCRRVCDAMASAALCDKDEDCRSQGPDLSCRPLERPPLANGNTRMTGCQYDD